MKRLTITYGDCTLFDSDALAQFQLTETEDGITVAAKLKRPQAKAATGGGLMDLLAGARKQPAVRGHHVADSEGVTDVAG